MQSKRHRKKVSLNCKWIRTSNKSSGRSTKKLKSGKLCWWWRLGWNSDVLREKETENEIGWEWKHAQIEFELKRRNQPMPNTMMWFGVLVHCKPIVSMCLCVCLQQENLEEERPSCGPGTFVSKVLWVCADLRANCCANRQKNEKKMGCTQRARSPPFSYLHTNDCANRTYDFECVGFSCDKTRDNIWSPSFLAFVFVRLWFIVFVEQDADNKHAVL